MNGEFTELYNKLFTKIASVSTIVEERWKAHADRSMEFKSENNRRFNDIAKQLATLDIKLDLALKEAQERRLTCSKDFDSKIRWYLSGFAIVLTIIGGVLKAFNLL